MRGRAATLFALLLVGSAAGQEQRLSDVASDIRLRPPLEDAVFVDLAYGRAVTSSSQNLVELADDYSQNLEELATLLSEIGVDDRFYAADWREQVLAACIDLDAVGYSLAAVQPPERLAAAYDDLIGASEECARGTQGIREAIRVDQPLYGGALRSMRDCSTEVSRSVGQMHRIRRAELQESQPAFDDPLAAAVGVTELCSARVGRAGPAFEECVAEQEDARRAIAGRFGFSVLLDEATFNVIRNSCRIEWPSDFVGRNRCERQRIAEAK